MLIHDRRTLVDALLAAPPERAFVTMWRDDEDVETITFGRFMQAAEGQAAELVDLGLKSGDRVLLIMPQDVALMAAFAGVMMAGAVPAILAYPNFKVEPAKYASGLAGTSQNLRARFIIIDDQFPEALRDKLSRDKDTRLIESSCSACSPARVFASKPAIESESLAFIQHSAGTTGLQKGVALSHRAVLTQLDHLAGALKLSEQDRIYSWLPLYHDMGLIACFMLPLVYHLPIVMQSPTSWVLRPETMLRLISAYGCTLAWVPNFALQFLSRRVRPEDAERFQLGSLRALINCSEPVRAHSIDEFQASYAGSGLIPAAVKTCYAMAENVFAVTQSSVEAAPRRLWLSAKSLWEQHAAVPREEKSEGSICLVSSGSCLPGNQVRIVAPDGTDLPDGHVGEILIRSDSLFDGYYNRLDLSAEALKENWYWSGDLGFALDHELYVIGRKKDLIIVAGKNIYPQDIEEIVSNHPAIHDGRAVAFALFNPDLGTDDIIIVAETESEEDLQAAAEIERSLRNAIVGELDISPRAIYLKPPRWIVKSTAGKPARSTSREKLLMEQPELVDTSHEYLLDRMSDCVILRSVQGRISSWNARSEQLYGWTRVEAIGRVSHELLATQFPEPLERIDARLLDTGGWQGTLVHSTRDGRRLVVESRWKLARESGRVAEINRLAA